MLDKTIQIKKDNQIICVLGSKYTLGYDNFIWVELFKLVNIVKEGFNSVSELINRIESNTRFVNMEGASDAELALDLDSSTIDMPLFPIYKPGEVNKENCCIDLKIKDGKYYSVYEDDEEYEMEYVTFDGEELLFTKNASIDNFLKVANFVIELINKYNDTDYVLNNKYIIRFNFI